MKITAKYSYFLLDGESGSADGKGDLPKSEL